MKQREITISQASEVGKRILSDLMASGEIQPGYLNQSRLGNHPRKVWLIIAGRAYVFKDDITFAEAKQILKDFFVK